MIWPTVDLKKVRDVTLVATIDMSQCMGFPTMWYFDMSSLQCYSVLSDILVKNELCIPLERGSMFYLLMKVSFAYPLPVSLKSLCVSVLSTKRQFRSVL